MKKYIIFLFVIFSISSFSQNTEKRDAYNSIYSLNGIEVKPEFPEGIEKLNSYIKENFQKTAFEKPVKGKFISTFVIEKDGSLSDIKILGKTDSRIADELIRILKSAPKWNPGKQNGIIVRVLYGLPIIISN